MKIKLSVIVAVVCLSVKTMVGQTNGMGGDKDKHGCRASAGYTFSVIKNDCIRVFEQEIKLDETNAKGTSTSIAAVIFSEDKTKAEVFIPGVEGGTILLREGQEGNYKWKKGRYSLLQNGSNGYTLLKRKKIIFNSPVSKGNPS